MSMQKNDEKSFADLDIILLSKYQQTKRQVVSHHSLDAVQVVTL